MIDDIHNSFESDDLDYESDDEDYFAIVGFDEEEARKQLLSFPDCTKIKLDRDLQQDMGVEVGPNVSSEKPWKQIRKEILEDYLPDDSPALLELKIKLREMEQGQLVLFGYISQSGADQDDLFIVFENEKIAKEASEIIRKLEILDRLKARNLVIKQPRKWETAGSEKEVDLFKPERRENSSYVEVQSTYPIRMANSFFAMRLCEDSRDGYVELVPGRNVIETVYKKTNDMPIQCGSIPCHKYQQTDPTFPTNAWSQYLYEIKREVDVKPTADEISKTSTKESRSQVTTPGTDLPIQASEKVKNLIGTLEFNKIDMYRDDYNMIARKPTPRYNTPHLEEAFCFADMSKTKDRYVSSMSWHPQFSGVVAVSYTFETFSTFVPNDESPNLVKRTILEKNPVLIWSFDDTLKPKLELVAPREVYTLSFCPYNPNILIGGMISGDIVLWDLKGCIERVEIEEVLTPEQASNRRMTREFLNWVKVTDTELVHPAAISNMEDSHLETISGVKWLPQNYYITVGGQVKESPAKDKRHFATSSLDGNICFWDLDWVVPDDELKKRKVERKFRVPVNLEVDQSPYVKLDMSWKPVYRLLVEKPLTGILLTEGIYRYEPLNARKSEITQRITHKIIPEYVDHFDMNVVVCTVFGQICTGHWEGFDFSQGAAVNEEKMPLEMFPPIHNDPVIAIERNPFHSAIFFTIGGTIFSIWKQTFKEAPIFWRERPCRITSGKWSKDRPGVLFLTLVDGTFEAWDFIARTNEPCLVECLGGNILTAMSQHQLSLARSVLVIGDYNSSLRVFLLPNAFVQMQTDEIEAVEQLFDRIEKIKIDQETWKRAWCDQNRDLIQSRLVAAAEMRAETKKIMEEEEQAARARPSAVSTNKPKKDQKRIDFAEAAEKKWNEQNYERLLKVLMERRRVNPEVLEKLTRPEKDRRQYQAEKKQAIEASFSRINEELAELRSKLIPKEVIDDSRERLVEGVAETAVHQMKEYNHVRMEAIDAIEKNAELCHDATANEILERARQRREIIDRALGGNPAKMEQYLKQRQRRLNDRMHHLSADISLNQSQMDRSNTMSLMSDFKMDETVVSAMSMR
ncbi:dynein axonemal intermediate chain 3 [Culicoides brevitarsis]|uniref:dynein axonemal intermediate chain 3 n=1 Tax=Culicoides brevitarsis TaxID=469753 RepID=UPI00307BEF14